jgi:hypothetical protein
MESEQLFPLTSEKISVSRLIGTPSLKYLQDLPSRFYFYELLNARKQNNYYQRATYEDKISAFPQPSTVLVFQEIDCLNAIVTTRPAYHEHLEVIEVCPRRT